MNPTISFFIDGSFFERVRRYYLYQHSIHRHLNIGYFQRWIAGAIGSKVNEELSIGESHYFRGKFEEYTSVKCKEADEALESHLVENGVVIHNRVIKPSKALVAKEKGIDVMLALEALQCGMKNPGSFVCIISGDEDFVPLFSKLKEEDISTVLVHWNFNYNYKVGDIEKKATTFTSKKLIDVAAHNIDGKETLDEGLRNCHGPVRNIFGLNKPAWKAPRKSHPVMTTELLVA